MENRSSGIPVNQMDRNRCVEIKKRAIFPEHFDYAREKYAFNPDNSVTVFQGSEIHSYPGIKEREIGTFVTFSLENLHEFDVVIGEAEKIIAERKEFELHGWREVGIEHPNIAIFVLDNPEFCSGSIFLAAE